jgi:hypothetical protein
MGRWVVVNGEDLILIVSLWYATDTGEESPSPFDHDISGWISRRSKNSR